ncbi:hypothetical protein ARSEF4850_002375 [Beauveria asiatica]
MVFILAAARVYATRLINRLLRKQWSFIVVGASGSGKTGLIEVLTKDDPNMTYFATTEPQYHDIPGKNYSVTEIPGSARLSLGISCLLLSKFDLIICVFHETKPETADYYRTLWRGKPPAPVVFVGNNVPGARYDPRLEPHRMFLGHQQEITLQGGIVCPYFPVSYQSKRSCKELQRFLSLGSWAMHKELKHEKVAKTLLAWLSWRGLGSGNTNNCSADGGRQD